MIKFAIVGNIASGKSTVEKFLKELGFNVLDTDRVCHELLVISNDVSEAFKDYDVFKDGEISRDKLGRLVFNNPELKLKLEDILYPKVRVKIEEFFKQNQDEKFAFVAIPLLFEAEMQDLFDKILFVYCDDDIRLNRLIARSGYSKDYAKLRMDSQMSQEQKIVKSDYVIFNNSTFDELNTQLVSLIEQIR